MIFKVMIKRTTETKQSKHEERGKRHNSVHPGQLVTQQLRVPICFQRKLSQGDWSKFKTPCNTGKRARYTERFLFFSRSVPWVSNTWYPVVLGKETLPPAIGR